MKRKFSTGRLPNVSKDAQRQTYSKGNHYDFVVVGSGMAGLTVSALLANAGYRVCILEAHDVPGGYAHSFVYPSKFGDFSFCAQVHYIWGCEKGGHIFEFLKRLGLEQEITFEKLDPSGYDRMVIPDGRKIFIPNGYDNLVRNIEVSFREQGTVIRKFVSILESIQKGVAELPEDTKDISWWEYPGKIWDLRHLLLYKNRTLQNVFDECGLSREVQAVLSAQAGDFMAPPNELSIFAYVGLFGGYNAGAYYPHKHFNHFIDGICKFITDHDGCHIYYETEVKNIVIESGRVVRVETEDGKEFFGEKYICNMDPQLASHMIGRENFPAEYQKKLDYEYSHTGLMVYLGLHGIDLREYGFGKFNTWHLEDWDMNETWMRELRGDYEKPWVFMSTPTLHSGEPGIAGAGCQILEVATLAGYDHFKKMKDIGVLAYQREKARVAEKILSVVRQKYIPDLDSHIALKLIGSPTTNEYFCRAPRGNAYGSHLTPENMGLGRLKSETPFDNLFWCNASSGYGGIAPTVGTGNALYAKLTRDRFYK